MKATIMKKRINSILNVTGGFFAVAQQRDWFLASAKWRQAEYSQDIFVRSAL